jgi:predicted nucleic-acid-binding Zn-ribbon protein
MKNTSTCPKCSGTEVKINTLGGYQNMALGEIYRCSGCGFSEIWSSKSHHAQVNALVIGGILIGLGVIGVILFRIYVNM